MPSIISILISVAFVIGGPVLFYQNLKKAGDPVQLALKYFEDGADELVFLDVSATIEGRESLFDDVKQVSKEVFIFFPFFQTAVSNSVKLFRIYAGFIKKI